LAEQQGEVHPQANGNGSGQAEREQPARVDRGSDKPVAPVKDPAKTRRRRIRVAIAVAVVAVGALLWWLHARRFEDTDDAQVDGNITAVSSRVPGTVIAVHVEDNQSVKQGDLLAELDVADLDVALAQARASVALAEAQLQAEQPSVSITQTSNVASVRTAEEEVANAQADLEAAERELQQAEANNKYAQQQRDRARQLVATNTIPAADYDQRVSAADAAAANVAAARKRIDQRRAKLQQAEARRKETEANAPRQLVAREANLAVRKANVELAHAQLRQAGLNLGYARIVAPVAGIVGKRSVNVGDRVQPGQQLMSITQVGDLWVTANFRETQIAEMKVGQKATVHVDAIDKDYDAKVESFAGATGSRYSLLPPENATGNYVKVVQRVPVRLRLLPDQAGIDRLRPGMSVEPKVLVR
jgi:membrane fusion protein (multidrug efflux system)